jgi:DNA-binding NarL/FixJ family response regulator
MRARILLADDHSITLSGIQSVIGQEHELIGAVGDGRTLVSEALRLRPQLIILDISMPLLNGIEAARKLRQAWPQVKLLFVSMHANAMYVREAMSIGACGYVLKTSAAEELPTAIRTVLKGGEYVSRSLVSGALDTGLSSRSAHGLTSRQREVLQLIAEGRTSKEVAGILGTSVKTANFHRYQLKKKLGVRSIAELAAFAVRRGLVG